MRIFYFLLASDAVGGLGPPADLVNKNQIPEEIGYLIPFVVLILIAIIVFFITKHHKGDK